MRHRSLESETPVLRFNKEGTIRWNDCTSNTRLCGSECCFRWSSTTRSRAWKLERKSRCSPRRTTPVSTTKAHVMLAANKTEGSCIGRVLVNSRKSGKCSVELLGRLFTVWWQSSHHYLCSPLDRVGSAHLLSFLRSISWLTSSCSDFWLCGFQHSISASQVVCPDNWVMWRSHGNAKLPKHETPNQTPTQWVGFCCLPLFSDSQLQAVFPRKLSPQGSPASYLFPQWQYTASWF